MIAIKLSRIRKKLHFLLFLVFVFLIIQPVSGQSGSDMYSVDYPESLHLTYYLWDITDFNASLLSPYNMTIGASIAINFTEAPAGQSSEELATKGWTIEHYIPHEENSTAYYNLKNILELYASMLIYIEKSLHQTRGEWFRDISNTTRTAEIYGYNIVEEKDRDVTFEYKIDEENSIYYRYDKRTGLLEEKISNSHTLSKINTDVDSESSDFMETHIDYLSSGGIIRVVTPIAVITYSRKFRSMEKR